MERTPPKGKTPTKPPSKTSVQLQGHQQLVTGVALSPTDVNHVASSCADGSLKVRTQLPDRPRQHSCAFQFRVVPTSVWSKNPGYSTVERVDEAPCRFGTYRQGAVCGPSAKTTSACRASATGTDALYLHAPHRPASSLDRKDPSSHWTTGGVPHAA